VPLRTYQRYEAGQLPVKKIEHQVAIAKALGVSVGRLVLDPRESKPIPQPAPAKSSLLGDIVLGLTALDDNQLRLILAYVVGISEVGRSSGAQKLPHKHGKL
jgi:hypothetical protein